MEHCHLRGVHYLEFTVYLIMKRQITLDGFSFVKTKQRYEIHIYHCVSLYACCSMAFKAQLLNLLTTKLSNFSQLQKILFSTDL